MPQLTPQSWGRIYWSGGAGKPGEMGGWRFHCNFCTEGNVYTAIARRPLADKMLSQHVIQKHSHKTEVRTLLSQTQIDDARIQAKLQSSTGAAETHDHSKCLSYPDERPYCKCGEDLS
jgi:hypothetical protein